jgi:hypothetical protein
MQQRRMIFAGFPLSRKRTMWLASASYSLARLPWLAAPFNLGEFIDKLRARP